MQDLLGSSITIEIAQFGIMAEQVGWIFGSGATRSRAEVTEVEVRACGGGVAWVVGGGGRRSETGSGGFDACADAEYGAAWGDSGAGAAAGGGRR